MFDRYSSSVALKITLYYAVIGALWIVFSDNILFFITNDPATLSNLQTIKGWFYIIITSATLYFLIKTNVQAVEKTKEELLRSNTELEATIEELVAMEEELKDKFDELKLNQSVLKQMEERYRLAIEGANDGIWDWDILNNQFYFERTKRILGYRENEIESNYQSFINLIHKEDVKRMKTNLREHFEKRTSYYTCEYRLKTKVGGYKWILSRGKTIWDEDSWKPIRMAGSHKDITDRKRAEEKIYKLAYYDSLTMLPNRVFFMESFKQALLEAKEYNWQVAILFLDVDNFKKINDTLGHYIGDEVLIKISKMLSTCLKETEAIFRLGGDEFMILQAEACEASAIAAAEAVIDVFKSPIKIKDYEFHLTASIGIAIYPQHGEEEAILYQNVDTAMYKAKELGKNCYQMFNKTINDVIMKKSEIERELRYAIDRDQLRLYYQPIFDIVTGGIISAEALLRWQHPEKGMISPMDFIPVAEETGLIKPIGDWVIREACRQNRYWQELSLPKIKVAVNISCYQFQQRDLLEIIKAILGETKLDPSYLSIEITESVAMQDLNYTTEVVKSMAEYGIAIALDDFGTGYSSLSYLQTLPINIVKIDKSFIKNLDTKKNQKQIAQAIINLAHGLNCRVTAEGVERQEELEYLKIQNCDFAQGFLFHKPLPPKEFEELLHKKTKG